jgi:type IV pilus assembly protein PilA
MVETSTAGVVTVTAQNIDATNIDTKKITLTPFVDSAGATTMSSSDVGKPVAMWKCGPAATSGVPVKYLPGSCRG